LFDFAIIGGGAAGINAAIYATRRGLRVALFEPGPMGGIINTTPVVENYLGFAKISGPDLAKAYEEHLKSYPDVKTFPDKVTAVTKSDGGFSLATESGAKHEARAVLFATGAAPRKLGAPGEAEFAGRGVSYCAICDAPLFKGRKVAVVGGGDSALTAALLVADIAPEVYLIHRRKEFRAEDALIRQAAQRPNIKLLLNKTIAEVKGEKFLTKLVLEEADTKAREELEVKGLFVYVGHLPASDLAKKLGCAANEHGFLLTNERMETSVPGVYAAGDVRKGSLAQLVTSAADGCTAALAAAEFLQKKSIKADWMPAVSNAEPAGPANGG
jgi:thioredoxin reductase (NADPH)